MARRRVLEAPVLRSWDEVDQALREIAEEEIILGDIQGDMNKQINGIKEIAKQQSKPHQDRISTLTKDVKEYFDQHREELGKSKTKYFNFGECGYRLSTSVTLPKGREKLAELIRRLKARRMSDCIITKETIDKEALRKSGEARVAAVGATLVQKDVFWLRAAQDKVEQLEFPRR